jgi:hypothetical protein
MRAIALATTVVIALAMSATPTLAADRTVQPLDEARELAALSAWIAEVERAWIGFILPGAGGLIAWTPVIVPDEEETVTGEVAQPSTNERRSRVILEDGAPF